MRHRTPLTQAAHLLASHLFASLCLTSLCLAPLVSVTARAQQTATAATPASPASAPAAPQTTPASSPQTGQTATPQATTPPPAPDEAATQEGPSAEAQDPEFRAALAHAVPLVPAAYTTQQFHLRLHNLHTLEDTDLVYRIGDNYQPQAIALLNYFLRDHNTQDVKAYDPREFDLLHDILVRLGRPNATIDIVCGYRTQWTNEMLRASSRGVAEHSQHILGHAIDIQIPGSSTTHIRDAALSLNEGGVGYYPVSHFVHVDVGAIRTWTYAPRRHRRGRGHAHLRSVSSHHHHTTTHHHVNRAAGM